MATEILVPTLGESVSSATVARWLKKAGEAVAADEPLVELETDKVTVEVNAPAAGVIEAIAADEGAEVAPGARARHHRRRCRRGAAAAVPAAHADRADARPRRAGRSRMSRAAPRRPARSPRPAPCADCRPPRRR